MTPPKQPLSTRILVEACIAVPLGPARMAALTGAVDTETEE